MKSVAQVSIHFRGRSRDVLTQKAAQSWDQIFGWETSGWSLDSGPHLSLRVRSLVLRCLTGGWEDLGEEE